MPEEKRSLLQVISLNKFINKNELLCVDGTVWHGDAISTTTPRFILNLHPCADIQLSEPTSSTFPFLPKWHL